MQVWNLLHAARWKCRTQKSRQKLPSGHHRTTLSSYIFATNIRIDIWKKLVKQQYVLQMSPQYGEHRPSWERLAGLGHPIIIQQVSCLGSVTTWQSSSAHQPNFADLNRGRHLCSAGWPSRWALANILVFGIFFVTVKDIAMLFSKCKLLMRLLHFNLKTARELPGQKVTFARVPLWVSYQSSRLTRQSRCLCTVSEQHT